MRRWYVVSTRPHQEARAAENLRRQSFNVWLPRLRRTRRHARRFNTILAPLFPGYLFVEFDSEVERWRSINGTFGVRNIVCSENGPLALPNAFVADIKARSSEDILCEKACLLEPGAQVRVVSGPFVESIGTLVRADSANRIRLLLRLLGSNVDVMLPSSSVISLA